MSRVSHRRPSAVLVAVLATHALVLGAIPSARAREAAAPTEDDARKAEGLRLYEEGTQRYDAGDYAGASEAFKASFDLIGDSLLLYNIAICYDRLDRYDDSLEYFRRYRAVAPAAEYGEIDRKIASVESRRDQAATPIEGAAEPEGRSTATPAARPGDDAAAPARPRVMGPAAWALLGTSVAALGVGLGFGLSSASARRKGLADCEVTDAGRLCERDGDDELHRASVHGIVSIVAISAGAALAVAAIGVIAGKATRGRRSNATRAQLRPTLGGLAGRF